MKLEEITTFISRHEVDIICLQETNLYNIIKIQIQRFETYRTDRSTRRKGGDVALTIRKGIPHSLLAPKVYPNKVDTIAVKSYSIMENFSK